MSMTSKLGYADDGDRYKIFWVSPAGREYALAHTPGTPDTYTREEAYLQMRWMLDPTGKKDATLGQSDVFSAKEFRVQDFDGEYIARVAPKIDRVYNEGTEAKE